MLYLVAPQVWAWREGRVRQIRRDMDHLLCIFPFEEPGSGSAAFGPPHRPSSGSCRSHPLDAIEFLRTARLDPSRPLVVLLPAAASGRSARHLPIVADAAARLAPGIQAVLAAPAGFTARAGAAFFRERIPGSSIQVIEGETSDALAHADVALAASGTVTVEAALLGTPMVTFYRVTPLSWFLGDGWFGCRSSPW